MFMMTMRHCSLASSPAKGLLAALAQVYSLPNVDSRYNDMVRQQQNYEKALRIIVISSMDY